MAEIFLSRLTIENFKGIDHFVLSPNRKGCTISGPNGVGKSTVHDAYMWLLWGKDSSGRKDFTIKPTDRLGNVKDHMAITAVEGEFWKNDRPILLRRTYFEKWSTKRGSSEETFDGHSSDYFINQVPATKRQFDEAVGDLVGDEATFQLMSSVNYFPEKLRWEERREKLFDLAGVQSDRAIMATEETFRPLMEALGDRELEDFRNMLTAQRKDRMRARTDIPARIDEQKTTVRSLEDVDFDRLREQRQALQDQEAEVRQKIAGLKGRDRTDRLKAQMAALSSQLQALEAENRLHRAGQAPDNSARTAAENALLEVRKRLKDKQEGYDLVQADIRYLRDRVAQFRAEYLRISGEKYQAAELCPTCGQKLPKARLDTARKRWEHDQELRLQDIQARAEEIKARQAGMEERGRKAQAEILELEQLVQERETRLAEIPEPGEVTDLPDFESRRAELESRIRETAEEMDRAGAPVRRQKAELEERLRVIRQETATLDRSLAQETVLEAARARIEELLEQARKAGAALEELDGMLRLIDKFFRYKAEFVEESINSLFEHARFRLFREQINGGLESCCDVTFGGIPYGSLNNAAQINIGIDIIRTFGKHTGVTVPLWVDHAESVTELWSTGGQMFRLLVDGKREELTVK